MIMKDLQKLESEFKSQIYIPATKPERPFLICPVGLVGAGKTTVVKPLAEKFNLVRVSSDELRKLLKENGHDYSQIKDIGMRVINDFAHVGHGIVFDMDCGNPLVKKFAEDLSKELDMPIFFLHITAPEEFIFDKFIKHPPTWLADNPQIMIDNHLAQKETRLKENTHFDYFYEFDTSRSDLAEQIEECVQKIKEAL